MLAIGLVAAGQLLLHAIYGIETFMYSAHYGPILILLASFSARVFGRAMTIGAAGTLVVLASINNLDQFLRAAEEARRTLHLS